MSLETHNTHKVITQLDGASKSLETLSPGLKQLDIS